MEISTRVSALSFVVLACYIIIFGFLWRTAAAQLAASDHPVGKAMAYIF